MVNSVVKNNGDEGSIEPMLVQSAHVEPMLVQSAHVKDETKLSFIKRFKHQPIFRQQFIYTMALCWAFIMLGWVESLAGPTFPDLRVIVNEDIDTASWLFTATSCGFFIGSVITGFLFNKYNKLLILIGSIVGTSVTIAILPWCSFFSVMMIFKFLAGAMGASLDTGGNAELVSIWRLEAAPYMQALHFCFSMGAMVSPLVAQPFLAKKNTNGVTTKVKLMFGNNLFFKNQTHALDLKDSNSAYDISFNLTNSTIDETNQLEIQFEETKVQYAYLIAACLLLLTAVPFIGMYHLKKDEIVKKTHVDETEARDPIYFNNLPKILKVVFLFLLSSLMFVYCGTEYVFAGFLTTFTISQLHWSKDDGSVATSVFWICFGLARLAAIFVVKYISSGKLLVLFPTMLAVSLTCLLISTILNIIPLVWISIGMCGLSMSVIFTAVLTWTNENIVTVSGKIYAMFMSISSLGVILLPPIFGYTMQRFSSLWFLYLLLGESIMWILLFAILVMLSKCLLKPIISEIDEYTTN